MKNLKRATIVGETTGGGAHPVSGHRIDDHFMIGVPFARAINPISGTNWEGTGVEPDVKVAAADALETARKLDPMSFTFPDLFIAQIRDIQGNVNAAIEEYRRLLSIHPGLEMTAAIESRIRALELRTR